MARGITGRFWKEGFFTGGMNVGRTATRCVQVDQPIPFCENVPPFNPEFKLSISYPLVWDIQASAVFQSVDDGDLAACRAQHFQHSRIEQSRTLTGGYGSG